MKQLAKALTILGVAAFSFTSCAKEKQKKNDETIKSFSSVTIGNQNHAAGNIIDLDAGKVYTLAQAHDQQENIDLIFYHDNPTNSLWIACPSSFSEFTTIALPMESTPTYGTNFWTTLTTMEIGNTDITSGTFDGISTFAALSSTFKNDYHVMIGAASNPSPGEVYKFRTGNGKIGLIRINSHNGNHSVSGSCKVDIKIQQ